MASDGDISVGRLLVSKSHSLMEIIAPSPTSVFRTSFAETIFNNKYRHEGAENWEELSHTLVEDVCGEMLSPEDRRDIEAMHAQMKIIAGGRYLYYAGRKNRFYNNCFLLKAEEDTREDWANLSWKSESCLMTGGGIGIDYSVYRAKGGRLSKTGGVASGPVSKMKMINEIGRYVMQGGSRRSAIYGSLNWRHPDAPELLTVKNWYDMVINGTGKSLGDIKEVDFNFPAPLDMTNISLNYDNTFLEKLYGPDWLELRDPNGLPRRNGQSPTIKALPPLFVENVRGALKTGEPGFSFNFFEKENETLRNACCEISSEDDSDVCNLGSINMSRFDDIEDFRDAVRLLTMLLFCGTFRAMMPYQKVYDVRDKNRRLGLGLMGVHEWLLKRGSRYEVTPELHRWLDVYKAESERTAKELANRFSSSTPIATRAIAPTGTIGILASTTTGIEPLLAVAYQRRYLKGGHSWHYQYVIDGTAQTLINEMGVKPDAIETALDLAADPERRVAFQADIQDYVDQAISSTINLPQWNTSLNHEGHVEDFARMLAGYAHRLRGFTCYPDGARGGQPLVPVDYAMAHMNQGMEFEEEFLDICDLTKGGTCGS